VKKKTLEFNLAKLTERGLIKVLDDNNADIPELMALLEALFDMWSSSLKFSTTVVEYGEQHFDGFLETFVKNATSAHGITPEKLAHIITAVRQQKPVVH
jgi:UDP-glucose 4-epimerase